MGNGESTAYMRPSEIRFSHDSIQSAFRDGRSLETTYREVLWDKITVDALPTMEVMQYNGHWFVVRGNRRLFLLKNLEKHNYLTSVKMLRKPYDEGIFYRQFTTPNMGKSVKIRGDHFSPFLEQRLDEIWDERQRQNWSCIIS
ncbi:uncharacterized protein LOC125653297 [Ostrea edulis]|uniref:uncharacterized protein LOC125653297 n=1 Tax=Ostrea edulis TaxID=37623 RepID=UPI0020964C3E|nr:uncharacterized protein LOC125653297 [Ostrea edulis]